MDAATADRIVAGKMSTTTRPLPRSGRFTQAEAIRLPSLRIMNDPCGTELFKYIRNVLESNRNILNRGTATDNISQPLARLSPLLEIEVSSERPNANVIQRYINGRNGACLQ